MHGLTFYRSMIALIAFACGVALAGLGGSPTGTVPADIALLFATGVFVVIACSRAPWWAITIVGGVACALAGDLAFLVLSIVGTVAAIVAGQQREGRSDLWSALAAGIVTVALCGVDVGSSFGASSLIAIPIGFIAIVIGIAHQPSHRRKRLAQIMGGALVAGTLAVAIFGLVANSARSELSDARNGARRGLDALATGDVDTARSEFAAAHEAFTSASESFDSQLLWPVRIVPIAAQNASSLRTLSIGARDATGRINEALSQIDLDTVRIVDGQLDVDAVRALQAPLVVLQSTIDDLDRVLVEVRDPWLIGAFDRRITEFRDDVESYRAQAATAVAAVERAPEILGAGGKRVYFIAFTTPAESRGSIGFMGNWAELTVTDGRFEMTRFGRATDLNDFPNPDRAVTDFDGFLDRYGGYGFNTGPRGTTAPFVWQIMTMSPNFPTVGRLIADLYPQSGGQQIDGVFALDPAALGGLLSFTGPIDAEGIPNVLDADNVEEFLNVAQYIELPDKPGRIDALEAVAETTVSEILDGALPGPTEIGRTFGPLVRDHHVAAWFADPDDQELAANLKMDHALPVIDGNGDIAVAINNSGASKIDAYAIVDVAYRRAWSDGRLAGSVDVTIDNGAPAVGLPPYVISNALGEPEGTNISYVSVFLPFTASLVTVDGVAADVELSAEQGWSVASVFLTIASGEAQTIHVEYAGASSAEPTRPPVVFGPDTRHPATVTVTSG